VTPLERRGRSPTRENRPAARVVVAEPFAASGLTVLHERGIEVVSMIGSSRAALAEALAGADGLIVRSEVRVDRELLCAGTRLAVVARAGVGVDAIDVAAATEAGIVVLNTPGANTIAATEQTFALMLSLCRHTPRAAAELRAGIWNRRSLVGTELAEKTLGIVGLGRIGGAVALRAKAFGMHLIATDPFISASRAEAFDAKLVPLEELLGRADIVTLHVPLTTQTTGMIGRDQLAHLRPHALLVNCARGGLIDEQALLDALDAGVLNGAALDVVAEEPPTPGSMGARLHRHPKVIATPHIGGSTVEALERIAVDLATDIAGVLLGGPPAAAVNAPVADGPDAETLRPYVDLAYRLGMLYPQVATSRALPRFALFLEGQIAEMPADPVSVAFLSGLLQATTDRRVSIVNAQAIAAELGVAVDVRRESRAGPFASRLRIVGGDTRLAGTSSRGGPRIVELDGYEVDAVPSGALVVTQHRDVPGMVGKVGTILGAAEINISAMQVSRNSIGGDAAMILSIDRPADPATVDRLRGIAGVTSVRTVYLPP
jgi:D-3-phosphoglycerate dehydrogenase / 2-oxoglutarate reductase